MVVKPEEQAKSSANDSENDVLKKIPDLDIAQYRFICGKPDISNAEKLKIWEEKLLPAIKEHKMAPFYEDVCKQLAIPIDETLLNEMKTENETTIKAFEDEIEDAVENLGESEVRDAWFRKSEYLCLIGSKDEAISSLRQTYEKTVGSGNRIDLIFQQIRLGLFFMDHTLITANISKAHDLMEQGFLFQGGDWDRKNRLRAYEALYRLSVRDFKMAANLFLDAVSTFGSYELMTYEQLIYYTVISAVFALERPETRERVLRGSEIQEQLQGSADLSILKTYVHSLYDCHYDAFFSSLAQLEKEKLQNDRYMAPHFTYYVRNMRLKAYTQFLTPYKTVSLKAMAEQFGVSCEFIDKELHSLIGAGVLHCRIDAVRQIIETNRPDSKNDMYKTVIRDGDILLNRIQKLARVINE